MATKKEEKNELRENALKSLREKLKAGSAVYTIVKHVSSSGMTRHISLFIVSKGEIVCIDWEASHIIGWKRNKTNGALVIGGCGMDMGFHAVYTLGRHLFPKGFKLPKGKIGRNGDKSGFDTDGGYALKQEWC